MGSEIVEGSSRAQPSLMLRANMKATGKLVEVGGVLSDYYLCSSRLF